MRPTSRKEGYQKLRTLRCFNEVHERILAGWEPARVAVFIQQDRDEYTDVSAVNLAQVLQRYRASIPPAQLMKTRMPEAFVEAKEAVDEGIDELKEMTKLYRLQMERIMVGVTVEKESKRLLPSITQDVRTAREVLAGIADLKMDLGLSQRASESVDVNVNVTTDVGRYGKKSVEEVMNDPERRRKVLNVAERMLAFPGRLEVIDATAVEVPDSPQVGSADPDDSADSELEFIPVDENEELEALAALEAEAELEHQDHVVHDPMPEGFPQ